MLLHPTARLQGPLRLLHFLDALLTAMHVLQELQGSVRLIALLACADRCTVADHAGFQAFPLHVLKELQGMSGCMPISHALIAAL